MVKYGVPCEMCGRDHYRIRSLDKVTICNYCDTEYRVTGLYTLERVEDGSEKQGAEEGKHTGRG